MLPAIFLPLNTLPGSWRWPVEPWLRWLIDTPCVARRPPKFQRFIGPGNALALVGAGDVDELAGDEVIDGELGADLDQVVGADAELDQLALRLDVGDRRSAAARPC